MTRHHTTVLNQIKAAWAHHPEWPLGRLLQSAHGIALGEIRTNPAYARDAELKKGLKALIPEGDEK